MKITPALRRLRESNGSERTLVALKTALVYVRNLLDHPDDDKFRSINLANMNFQSRVYQVVGGEEVMAALGFVKEGPRLVFSGEPRQHHDDLRQATGLLQAEINSLNRAAAAEREGPARRETISRLTSLQRKMHEYESPSLQAEARACIPITTLKERASSREDVAERSERDRLLLELLAWFKNEFFTWVNALPCANCNGETHVEGGVAPTDDDLRWGAHRVELHRCKTCGFANRFPRYNHPGKLLQSRRGRCGEWANCFVLCARALSFETRYIFDYTDHVWAEVYSDAQGRWLHCDPCENACDTPRMYETGWGKKLSYIFAFTYEEVADVIWRYSGTRGETLERRTQVAEDWLRETLHFINTQLQGRLSPSRRQELEARRQAEQVELDEDVRRELAAQELQGRQSGEEAWRRQRGELGAAAPAAAAVASQPLDVVLEQEQNAAAHATSAEPLASAVSRVDSSAVDEEAAEENPFAALLK